MKSLTRIYAMAVGSIAFLLAACGDTVENVNQMGMDVVTSEDDLPKCSGSNEGEQAFVMDAGTTLICVDGKWVPSVSGEGAEFSCKTVELKDKSGLKIVCNGDSIGVVLNGSDGKAGKDGKDGDDGKDGNDGASGSGCSITDRNDTAVVVVCGDSTMTISLGVGQSGDTLEGDLDREPISLDSLAGYTQKGPFLKGSTVYLYELSDGRTLKQTNGNFTSSISSDDGRYKFSARDLVSQYAMVVVDGYYRNEVTGLTSDATIRLKAITDMRKRSSVNVNLLTHMEYDRVYSLVTREKKTVKQAKQQAQEELLKIFHIELDGKTDAEDMDVFGKTDADAALLAISVILQGDRSEADLASLLAAFAADLSDNGLWDNIRDRAQIADWAMKKTLSKEGLASIRKNVEGWGLGDGKAPAFEGMIENFWETELKIGECSSENPGAIKAVNNKYSTYFAQKDSVASEGDSSDVRLICAADGDTYAWRYATDIEKNTAAITGATDGLAKRGTINTQNVYVYDDGKWRRGTDLDSTLNLSCIADRAGKIVKSITTWYTCDTVPTAWREATTAEADTAGFGVPTGDDPIVRIGNVNTSITYVYENKKWRQGTDLDRVGDLGACTLEKVNKVVHLSKAKQDEDWYKCDSYKIVVGNEVQVSSAWREATDFEADTAGIGAKATEIRGDNDITGVILKGNLTSDSFNYYIYESGKWRKADTREADTYDHTNHVAWNDTVDGAFRQGPVTKAFYVFDENEGMWRQETSELDHDPVLNGCTNYRSNHDSNGVRGVLVHKVREQDTLHYVCLDNLWRKADSARVNTEGYPCSWLALLPGKRSFAQGAPYDDLNDIYACEADTFRVLTESEKWAESVSHSLTGRCGAKDNGNSIVSEKIKTKFVCNNGYFEWDKIPVYKDTNDLPYAFAEDSAGNKYATVAIGTQLWTASNLRLDIEETLVPHRSYISKTLSGNDTILYAAIDPDSIDFYGRLYKFNDAVRACAKMRRGSITFHLPTRDDWNLLFSHESGGYNIAKAYKATYSWDRFAGEDKYMFGAVATGYGMIDTDYPYKVYYDEERRAKYWTADSTIEIVMEGEVTFGFTADFNKQAAGINTTQHTCISGCSWEGYHPVRCVADLDVPLPPKNPNK